jgi:hypothetical protein
LRLHDLNPDRRVVQERSMAGVCPHDRLSVQEGRMLCIYGQPCLSDRNRGEGGRERSSNARGELAGSRAFHRSSFEIKVNWSQDAGRSSRLPQDLTLGCAYPSQGASPRASGKICQARRGQFDHRWSGAVVNDRPVTVVLET